jgi:prefoldin subunit 5|tara:strand:+ start:102 stop:410 length:309 start_codon:yes stop_codon:yes gene_type:complete
MTEQRVLELLAAGVFTQVEADTMIVDIRRRDAVEAEANKAEEFLKKIDAAPLHTVKRMVKQKAATMQVTAALMDDAFEAKAKRKKAYNLSRSIRGVGGVSFD